MRLEDYIHVEHKVISDELINQIISEYDSSSDWKPGTINDYEVKKNRKCEVIYPVSYTHLTLPTPPYV